MTVPPFRLYEPGEPVPSVSNRFAALIPSQSIAILPEFTLESGYVLREVSVAFRTWGKLNASRDNAMVICHALTGSSDVEDWWGPLLGPDRAFDPTRYFIVCANVLGSPYGTSSPVTRNPNRQDGKRWGPEFPQTSVRDDVKLQKLLLDFLGIKSVAAVIGGSMGGMAVLEWPLCTPPGYVRNIVPIATSPRHSAWGISWGEAQRQSIWSDPDFDDGWYTEDGDGPKRGLAAARMAALLTYRSRDSFESRFGRKEADTNGKGKGIGRGRMTDAHGTPRTHAERAEAMISSNGDGHGLVTRTPPTEAVPAQAEQDLKQALNGDRPSSPPLPLTPGGHPLPPPSPPPLFSAQTYLRYQGDKFVSRFDANCYIHLTRKMDAHDVNRGRSTDSHPLSKAPRGALVIAISTDGLFTLSEQRELASALPDAELVVVDSPDGHDGFLLEFEQIDRHLLKFLHERLPSVYEGERLVDPTENATASAAVPPAKASLFGEAEGDITRW